MKALAKVRGGRQVPFSAGEGAHLPVTRIIDFQIMSALVTMRPAERGAAGE